MNIPDSGGVISYSYKEILAEIRDNIAIIKGSQESHERRILQLEETAKRNRDAIERRLDPGLTQLMELSKISAALNKSIEERAERGFTRHEKVFALLIGIAAVGLSAASLLMHH